MRAATAWALSTYSPRPGWDCYRSRDISCQILPLATLKLHFVCRALQCTKRPSELRTSTGARSCSKRQKELPVARWHLLALALSARHAVSVNHCRPRHRMAKELTTVGHAALARKLEVAAAVQEAQICKTLQRACRLHAREGGLSWDNQ